MRKVKILASGKILVVSNNAAFGLVDSGKATYDLGFTYPDKMLVPEKGKRYRTK